MRKPNPGTDKLEPQGTYKLIRPINFEGKDVTEFAYDLWEIDGNAQIRAERAVGLATGDAKANLYASPEYLSELFAAAANKPVELIRSLKGPDFAAVTNMVTAFLLAPGLI